MFPPGSDGEEELTGHFLPVDIWQRRQEVFSRTAAVSGHRARPLRLTSVQAFRRFAHPVAYHARRNQVSPGTFLVRNMDAHQQPFYIMVLAQQGRVLHELTI